MLTFVVTSTPATGVLAALSQPTNPMLTGATLLGIDAESEPAPTADPTPAPTPEPAPNPTADPTTAPEPNPTADPTPPTDPTPTADPTPSPAPTATPEAGASAAVVTPPAQPRPRVVAASRRPARLWAQLRSGLTVRGVASWYGATRGYAGIAHVAMPGARYLPRGRDGVPRARVCAAGRCVVVRVVDACGCYVRTPRARVADLSWTTLRRLGLDPRRGVYRVNVTLIRG